jgi:predicted small lipoprotein YifL
MKYAMILLCVLALAACGKKGPLEPRPGSAFLDPSPSGEGQRTS